MRLRASNALVISALTEALLIAHAKRPHRNEVPISMHSGMWGWGGGWGYWSTKTLSFMMRCKGRSCFTSSVKSAALAFKEAEKSKIT